MTSQELVDRATLLLERANIFLPTHEKPSELELQYVSECRELAKEMRLLAIYKSTKHKKDEE
jgi:hypothetical protein